MALEFRQQFQRDVVVDIYCCRRHGHNEGDEPIFTQPSMYADINAHPSVATLFEKQLIENNVLTQEQADALEKEFEVKLDAALNEVKQAEQKPARSHFSESTAIFQTGYSHAPADTAVSKETLEKIVSALTRADRDRLAHLMEVLPARVSDAAAAATTVTGVLLLLLGHGLRRRKRRASPRSSSCHSPTSPR